MTTLLWVAALLLLPLLFILWLTESRQTRICRMRRNGWNWQRIADHYGVKSASTPKRWMEAA